jgi:hypothetical protein
MWHSTDMAKSNCAFCGTKIGSLFTSSTKLGDKLVITCSTCQFVYKKSIKSVGPVGIYRCPACLLFLQSEQERCSKCEDEKKIDWFIPFNSKDYATLDAEEASRKIPVRTKKIPKDNSLSSLEEFIEAQDRTTHAVRSLAITFVAAPIISLLVIGGLFFALQSESTGMIIGSAVIGLIVGLGTLFVALEELRKSKP